MKEDLEKIRSDVCVCIVADKTQNRYMVGVDDYNGLLEKEIHKDYKSYRGDLVMSPQQVIVFLSSSSWKTSLLECYRGDLVMSPQQVIGVSEFLLQEELLIGMFP